LQGAACWLRRFALDLPSCRSSNLQIFGAAFAAFGIDLDLKRQLLALSQVGQSGAFYGADMNEYIVAAIIWLNEAKSLLAVEPLDRTCCHNLSLFEARQRITTVPLKYKLLAPSRGARFRSLQLIWLCPAFLPKKSMTSRAAATAMATAHCELLEGKIHYTPSRSIALGRELAAGIAMSPILRQVLGCFSVELRALLMGLPEFGIKGRNGILRI
jgi:hypothetical protein